MQTAWHLDSCDGCRTTPAGTRPCAYLARQQPARALVFDVERFWLFLSMHTVGREFPSSLMGKRVPRTADRPSAESRSGFSHFGRLIVVMDYRGFEAEFLRLAFTTSYELTPCSTAFLLGLPVPKATEYMRMMVDEGTLELDSNDVGDLRYIMPERPEEPFPENAGLWDSGHPLALAAGGEMQPGDWNCTALVPRLRQLPAVPEKISPGRATAALFINALVCPGMGSMVGGRNAVGVAQMSLFMVGLPLAVVNVGLPLLAAAWAWGIFSGAKLVNEASE